MINDYGILGCGIHSYQHAFSSENISGLQLTSVCDVKTENMDNFCAKFGKPLVRFTEASEFLKSGIKAVVITTPDKYHIENLNAAIEAGLHVLVEKPIAIDEHGIGEFESLLSKAAARGLVVTSCHPRRFDPPFVWLKEKLPQLAAKFGPAISFSFDFSYQRPLSARKRFISLMEHHVSHEVDMVDFLFGSAGFKATANVDTFTRFEVDGYRPGDGLSFHFHGTLMLGGREDAPRSFERVTVRFERGDLMMDITNGIARIMDHETHQELQETCPTKNYPVRSSGVMQNFSDAIQGIGENYLSPHDLLLSSRIGAELHKYTTVTIE